MTLVCVALTYRMGAGTLSKNTCVFATVVGNALPDTVPAVMAAGPMPDPKITMFSPGETAP